MYEIEERLEELKQQFLHGEITQDTFERREKQEKIKRLEADLKAGKIIPEDYYEKIIEINNSDEDELDKIILQKKNSKKRKANIICFVILGIIASFFIGREIYRSSIISSNTIAVGSLKNISEPIQKKTDKKEFTIDAGGFTAKIDPLAEYSISGVVLNTVDHNYQFKDDVYSHLAPVDINMAWGVAGDNANKIKATAAISRGDEIEYLDGNWLAAVGHEKINKQISNNHLIPASDDIRTRLRLVRKGDHIKMDGFLVGVYSDKASPWISSLERGDSHPLTDLQRGLGDTTRDNACEIIYVTDLKWLKE